MQSQPRRSLTTNTAMQLLLTAMAANAFSPEATADDYICRANAETRLISVIYDHKGWQLPCSVRYEKPKENSITYPWRAEATPGYCEGRAQFLAEKLAGFGWDCQVKPVEK